MVSDGLRRIEQRADPCGASGGTTLFAGDPSTAKLDTVKRTAENPSRAAVKPEGTKGGVSALLKHPFTLAMAPVVVLPLIGFIVSADARNFAARAFGFDRHSFSFNVTGNEIDGTSESDFVAGQGYVARAEACDVFTAQSQEHKRSAIMCYITVRAPTPLAVTNELNLTRAYYSDNTTAEVCCIQVQEHRPVPISEGDLAPGDTVRQSFAAGTTIEIVIQIPDPPRAGQLDSILFSPGNGRSPTLLPVSGNLRVFEANLS